MRNIKKFKDFSINESSAAGNRDNTYEIPFKFTSNDPRYGYNSRTFVEDLKSIFIEKPALKKQIIEFLSDCIGISSIDDLILKPFSLVSDLIPEIERIIEAGEYEPELIMPGGALIFIRNKVFSDGTGADFYINRKGNKIEVVTDNPEGGDRSSIYNTQNFPFDRYEFTEEEREELEALIKAKGLN